MNSEENFAYHFSQLRVYKMSRELWMEIFEHSKRFPREEIYSITDQMRRSSRSVGAAWGKRRYPKHFVSKMTDAEQLETQHWIELSLNCKYITSETATELTDKCKNIGKMIYGINSKADQFSR